MLNTGLPWLKCLNALLKESLSILYSSILYLTVISRDSQLCHLYKEQKFSALKGFLHNTGTLIS